MRFLALLVFCVNIAACSGGGGSAASDAGSNSGWTTYSVATSTSLPSCAGDIVGRLYYVEDSQIFQVCKSTGWETIALGNSIQSNRIISNSATDYCSQYANEGCFFSGGQMVKYADGSVLILGGWTFLYSIGAPDADSDHSVSSISVLFPPSINAGYQRLSPLVARGTGYKAVFLVYTRSPETIRIVHDTDGDGVPEPTDELLYTASLLSW